MTATGEISADRRLLFVHAHPDDETLSTGATMAKYAAEGAHVTLVTCTSGEEGEVLLSDMAHIAAEHDDTLGEHRRIELADAMAALGVADHRLLGGPGRFRDSGMIETPANERPDNFWRADLLVAAVALVEVIREVRPQVLVTYDDFGGYGHPDHVQAHRVATYAASLAAVPSFRPELGPAWGISKIYWTAFPRSVMKRALALMGDSVEDAPFGGVDPDEAPFLVDDEYVTTAIDATAYLPAKLAAMHAHASQIDMEGPFFALVAVAGDDALGMEFFRLASGPAPAGGVEDDLFAGIG